MNATVEAWLRIGVGLIVLVGGGESLLRGASRLAAALRISPLVIGLTVVAFGTSAPEMAVSILAALNGNADLTLGNVVGSNIFNVLFILGVSALIVPLTVSSQLIRRDVLVMIMVSIFVLVLGWDGSIQRLEGLLLLVGIVAYTWRCIRQGRRESREVKTEFAQQWPPSQPSCRGLVVHLVLITVGLALLGLGSRLLVDGSIELAESLGVGELVIGLTIIAAGTSLPELVTSLIAAIRCERDIAVGNVVGSNIFNILCVLGVSGMIGSGGVAVSPSALAFDIPVMIVVAIACLPIFFSGHLISRWEGGLFLFYYVAYTIHLVLQSTGNELTRPLHDAMLFFVIPLTVITLLVTTWRSRMVG